jgi:hypothetical protein
LYTAVYIFEAVMDDNPHIYNLVETTVAHQKNIVGIAWEIIGTP